MTIDGPGSSGGGGSVTGANVGAGADVPGAAGVPLGVGLSLATGSGLVLLVGSGAVGDPPGDAPADALGEGATSATGLQLCMRLLTTKSAMRAIIARIARPTARRLVKPCMAERVYVEGSAGRTDGPLIIASFRSGAERRAGLAYGLTITCMNEPWPDTLTTLMIVPVFGTFTLAHSDW